MLQEKKQAQITAKAKRLKILPRIVEKERGWGGGRSGLRG
jgi:hypothetical protein